MSPMDARNKLRLLLGAGRPFLIGKIIDAMRGKRHIPLPVLDVDPRLMLERSRKHHWIHGVDQAELAAFAVAHPTTDARMWAVAMDVGIRLANLASAGINTVLSNRRPMLEPLHREMILQHARWVWEHLETAGGMATSHLLGGLYGLACACAAVTDDAWLNSRAQQVGRMLYAQMQKQILADGMSFEASTAYHRHVVDLFVHTTNAMLQHPVLAAYVDDYWWTRLHAAVEALDVLEQAGMPLIGDNDDGMAVKLDDVFPATPTTSHLFSTYEGISGRTGRSVPMEHSAFPEFGLDVWMRRRFVLTARCGSIGQYGKGGHAHNDQNSITLRVHGDPVIIDSGTYCYTADAERRNYDRSTRAHSTVVSAIEQRAWPTGTDGLFWLIQSHPDPIVCERSNTNWHGRVVHQNKRGYEHDRTLRIQEDQISITDTFGTGDHPAEMVLILDPTVHAVVGEAHAVLQSARATVEVHWEQGQARIEPCNVAPAYLTSQITQRLVVPIVHGALNWTLTLPR